MNRFALALAAAATAALLSPAAACEALKPVDPEAAQKMMSILESAEAKPLDQIFAFQTLACSDQPILRRFAGDEALKSKNRLLRAQGLAEIILQRESLRIEMVDAPGLPEHLRTWLKNEGNTLVYRLAKPNAQANCIAIGNGDCTSPSTYAFHIDGEKVRLYFGNIVGDFALADGRTLRGTVKNGASPPVQAKMVLE